MTKKKLEESTDSTQPSRKATAGAEASADAKATADTEIEETTKEATPQTPDESCKDQLVRVQADFQNYKRRTEKERAQWIVHAQVRVLESILPLVDELELALKSSEQYEFNEDTRKWLEGFTLMQQNLHKRLEKLGVKEIDCSGSFDPQLHEALMNVDSPDHESGAIVAVLSKGYVLGDEVLRHAKVSVAK